MFENHKKELGMALQEMKSADWFSELPKEDQEWAVQSTKNFYTPPNQMENTILNLVINPPHDDDPDFVNLAWVEWLKYCAQKFPWADPVMGNAQVNLHKRMFFTNCISNGMIKWPECEA